DRERAHPRQKPSARPRAAQFPAARQSGLADPKQVVEIEILRIVREHVTGMRGRHERWTCRLLLLKALQEFAVRQGFRDHRHPTEAEGREHNSIGPIRLPPETVDTYF